MADERRDAASRELDAFILRQYAETVRLREEALSVLLWAPSGMRLCWHQPWTPWERPGRFQGGMAVQRVHEYHYLQPDAQCSYDGRREEWGLLPLATDQEVATDG